MKYSCEELLLMEPEKVYEMVLTGCINNFPRGFFTEINPEKTDKYARLTRYLIEEKLKWSEDNIYEELCLQTFLDNRLGRMIRDIFNNSIHRAIENAYPGKFKVWLFKRGPKGYWTKETAREATIWLLEEKMKWTDEEICKKTTANIFRKNNLSGMLQILFANSPYLAIENAYPGRFKPWQLGNITSGYWNNENAREVTKWLLEEKMKWSDEEICRQLSVETFKKNGLAGMLVKIFKGSPYEAIESIYPGRFKPWQLKHAPQGYWTKETAKEATIWLIEEKLKWTEEEICEKFTRKVLKENGLAGMISVMFSNCTYDVINNAYPGKFVKVGKKIKIAK